jgi:hypothetical protein
VHCHLLFHLPSEYQTGAKLDEMKDALDRLVGRHGDGILGEFAVKLVIWPDPDGLYLIKGGGLKCGSSSLGSESLGARRKVSSTGRGVARHRTSGGVPVTDEWLRARRRC